MANGEEGKGEIGREGRKRREGGGGEWKKGGKTRHTNTSLLPAPLSSSMSRQLIWI